MTANRGWASWGWLLIAAGLLVFAIVWWSQSEDAAEESTTPSLQNTGRMPARPGGDFASERPDRPIERRERPMPSTYPRQGSEPTAPRTPN